MGYEATHSSETSVAPTQRHERIEPEILPFPIWIDRGPLPEKPTPKPELKPGQYPGGSQVDGWTPLTNREPWSVPEPDLPWLPNWYKPYRELLATWLEVFRRLPLQYKLFAALACCSITALLPGPNVLALAAPFVLTGGSILAADFAVVAFVQPLVLAFKVVKGIATLGQGGWKKEYEAPTTF